jgi:hypothetical protein
MINPFVSPLFEAGEVLLGLSISMFVAGLVATYGESLRWRRRECRKLLRQCYASVV